MRPPPADFTDLEVMRRVSPARLYLAVSDGVFGSAMEGYRGRLGRQERWDVVYYLWQFPASGEQLLRGAQVWSRLCGGCPLPPAAQMHHSSREAVWQSLPPEGGEEDRWAAVEHLWTLYYRTSLLE